MSRLLISCAIGFLYLFFDEFLIIVDIGFKIIYEYVLYFFFIAAVYYLECRGYYYINDKENDENENKQDVTNEE